MDSIHRKDLVATPVAGLSGLAGSNSTGSLHAALRSLTRWSGKGLMKSIAVLALALTAQLAAALPDLSAWGAFYLPAGTPKPIVDRLHGELLAVLRSPDMIQRIKTLRMAPTGSTVAELDTFTRQQIEIYRRIIQEFKIEPEG